MLKKPEVRLKKNKFDNTNKEFRIKGKLEGCSTVRGKRKRYTGLKKIIESMLQQQT